jgi:hypothetical protein
MESIKRCFVGKAIGNRRENKQEFEGIENDCYGIRTSRY